MQENKLNVQVGDGATIYLHSDTKPCTVVSVEKKKNCVIVKLQEDNYRRTDRNGMSETQEYEYSQNLQGRTHLFQIKDEQVSEVVLNEETGRFNKVKGLGVSFGKRTRYYNFSM